MPFLLFLLHGAAALLAGVSAVGLFFAGSAAGLVGNDGFTARMAVLGALAGAIGGVLAAVGAFLALRRREAPAGGFAAFCWLVWVVGGSAGGALQDRGVLLVPVVALVTFTATLFVSARAAEKPT